MTPQFHSLKALRARVDALIEQQGEDAPMAAWIYTSEDVCKYDEDGDDIQQPQEVCASVLLNIQECDWIYASIADAIDSELPD